MEKKNPVAKKQAGKAPVNETTDTGRDDAAQGGAGAMPQEYYKSQKEVDAAFARRLDAERKKWARLMETAGQAQPGMMPNGIAQAGMAQPTGVPRQSAVMPALPQATAAQPGMAGPVPQDAALTGMPQMGASPLQPGADISSGIAPQAGLTPGMAGETPEMAQDAAAQPNEDFARVALRLLAEEADIQQVFPQFDLESFLQMGEGVQNALLSGKSLWSVFSAVYGETLRRQAEDAALERIRDRNAGLPDVLRGGGAAGSVGMDYANMPSEQFQKLRKAYEAEMRSGKKVKP